MRFSTNPAKQLLYLFLNRDMKESYGYIGIDAGCGYMENKPFFKTDRYVGIDTGISQLLKGKIAYPEAHIIHSSIESMKVVVGDVVVCVQVMTANNILPIITMDVVESLVNMVNKGGTLIFNISKAYFQYQKDIDNMLSKRFLTVKKIKYGSISRQMNIFLSLAIAVLTYKFEILRNIGNPTKIYYKCDEKINC